MPDTDVPLPAPATSPASAEVTALLLATFADLYRQEVGAEEDVHRTLPFFGTALGIVIASLAYAAGRLPKWPELPVIWGQRAVVQRKYQRIGPEAKFLSRLAGLQDFYDEKGTTGQARNDELLEHVRQMLLDPYTTTTPLNRAVNQERYKYRARASSHLVRSLIWALSGTIVKFIADKLGYFLKAGL